MHELGLCEDIVAAVEQRAAGGRGPGHRRVGRLHHVHPEAFDQSFAMAAAGGVAEGARADWCCCRCGSRCQAAAPMHEADELIAVCPDLRLFDLELTGGDELLLESIEYAEASGS